MELSDYVETSVYSVLKGLQKANDRITSENIGKIWVGDFNTISTDLVGLRIAKGQVDEGKYSVPVLIFDFDINVTVSEEINTRSDTEISVGAKILSVVKFKGEIDAGSNTLNGQLETQNLKFSVPVSFTGQTSRSA